MDPFKRQKGASVCKSVTEKKYRTSAVRNAKKINQMLLKKMEKDREAGKVRTATAQGSSPISVSSGFSSITSSQTSFSYDSDASTALPAATQMTPPFDHELMCRRVRLPCDDDSFLKGSVIIGTGM